MFFEYTIAHCYLAEGETRWGRVREMERYEIDLYKNPNRGDLYCLSESVWLVPGTIED